MTGNTVQLQEYVYKTEIINDFLESEKVEKFKNDMWPGILAIYSLQSKILPYVRLKNSIGIFRQGTDSAQEWRHLWWRYALIDWSIYSEKMFENKWLTRTERELSKKVFTPILKFLCWRIDILLGLNYKSNIKPHLLFKYHGYHFILTLLKSPLVLPIELLKRLLCHLRRNY